MKKITSIFTAVVILMVVLCSNILPAFACVNANAKNYSAYTDGSKYYVYTECDEDLNCYVYRYDGGGIVTNWEFVGLKEGVDYDVYAMGEAHIAIKYIGEQKQFEAINITVDFDRWQTALYVQDITAYVNGLRSYGGFKFDLDGATEGHIFTYTGEGTVVGWELPNLKEGVNYEVLAKDEKSFTVKLINGQNEIPYLNVFVDFGRSADETDFGIDNTVPVNIKVEASISSVEVGELSSPTDEEISSDNAENSMPDIALFCAIAGVCVIAAVGIIIIVVKNKKKSA